MPNTLSLLSGELIYLREHLYFVAWNLYKKKMSDFGVIAFEFLKISTGYLKIELTDKRYIEITPF